ncbi:RICIN domain-containing protein [Streptomyces sp. NRRL S-350]|uniref:RICIN domain-containing protein n=1 Tax=Streptomyces sp. NRRL S-350 TaxID=1463902 RepID=UPI0004C0F7E1|nr:RICIN domain-containing protein [Streptomyces sp. NRRL S-350]
MSDVVNDDGEFKRNVVAGVCGALGDTGVGTRAATRMESNGSTNVLLAVMLNAFARQATERHLSDLESGLVGVFTRAGFTAGELGEMGRAFAEAAPEVRGRFFPGRFAALGMEDAYSLADLRADLPQLGRDFLATCKNIRAVDATRLMGPLGEDVDAQAMPVDPGPSAAFLQETAEKGWGLVCVGLPEEHPAVAAAQSGDAGPYFVSLDAVTCHRKSNEWGHDEPKFSLALCDGDAQRAYTTEQLSMKSGDIRAFEPNRLWSSRVANGGLATVVDAWEIDHGGGDAKAKFIIDEVLKIFMNELTMETWQDVVYTIIGELTGVGLPAPVAGLFVLILGAVRALLTNEDDHIGTYSLLVPEPALMLQKQIQDTLRNPPPGGVVPRIADLTGQNEAAVRTFLAAGAYWAYRPQLHFDAGSDGTWQIGFLLVPDSSRQVSGLPARVRLESVYSGKFASTEGSIDHNGPAIHQWEWKDQPNQRWDLERLPNGSYKFTSFRSPTRVMTIHGPYPGNAPTIILQTWNDGSHQKWQLLPVGQNEYFIVSDYRGGAMSIEGPTTYNGAKLIHYNLRARSNQVWRILGA